MLEIIVSHWNTLVSSLHLDHLSVWFQKVMTAMTSRERAAGTVASPCLDRNSRSQWVSTTVTSQLKSSKEPLASPCHSRYSRTPRASVPTCIDGTHVLIGLSIKVPMSRASNNVGCTGVVTQMRSSRSQVVHLPCQTQLLNKIPRQIHNHHWPFHQLPNTSQSKKLIVPVAFRPLVAL